MELIDINAKQIMERCKEKAKNAGLKFDPHTLEYNVTNRDMIELSPKVFIPTMYDYWIQDIHVLHGEGEYQISPHNAYETVINSRPAMSFYNDNNTDWMNTMIFYHVLGHIDFFQNNALFSQTWNDDFVGQSLANKRAIERLRSKHGRWVDYVIEAARGLDNIVGFHEDLNTANFPNEIKLPPKVDFYFNIFLKEESIKPSKQSDELEKYNKILDQNPELIDSLFFADVKNNFPEFEEQFKRYKEEEKPKKHNDVLEYILHNSPKLRKKENEWMKEIITIVREAGLYFAPQMRTKIMNEGWASYWHDELFRNDEIVRSREIDYAKLNAGVTALTKGRINPYAIGLRLIQYVEELADKGKLTYDFEKIKDTETREKYDLKTRKAEDYKKMLIGILPDPPHITVNLKKTNEESLYLKHHFEGKPLITQFIPNTMIGIEHIWGNAVLLDTTEVIMGQNDQGQFTMNNQVRYKMKDKKIRKRLIEAQK